MKRALIICLSVVILLAIEHSSEACPSGRRGGMKGGGGHATLNQRTQYRPNAQDPIAKKASAQATVTLISAPTASPAPVETSATAPDPVPTPDSVPTPAPVPTPEPILELELEPEPEPAPIRAPAPIPVPAADLTVTEIAAVGDVLAFTVQNVGQAPSPETRLDVSLEQVARPGQFESQNVRVLPLLPNQSVRIRLHMAPLTDIHADALVDPDHLVTESNELNNNRRVTLSADKSARLGPTLAQDTDWLHPVN